MFVSIDDAGKNLDDLVSNVEAGGEVVLTRGGRTVARLVTVASSPDVSTRRAAIQAARRSAQPSVAAGDTAARSQDFLYVDDGLPG